jgi:hypothetical protein
MVIDKKLLDEVSEQAKFSPRLRMNYNFHQSLDDRGTVPRHATFDKERVKEVLGDILKG